MPFSEVDQLPLSYKLPIVTYGFLRDSLMQLRLTAERSLLGSPLGDFAACFYLLCGIALSWGHPYSNLYKPGCWVQPLPGRNFLLCGPTPVLSRLRICAARLGVCLLETQPRGEGRGALSFQCYWELPGASIAIDLAQMGLLSIEMPSCYGLPPPHAGPQMFQPIFHGYGVVEYVTGLMGVSGTPAGLLLALRSRNVDPSGWRLRNRGRILDSLSACFNLSVGSPVALSPDDLRHCPLCCFAGLATEDITSLPGIDRFTAFNSQVDEFDRNRMGRSFQYLDGNYIADLLLMGALDIDSDDEDVDGPEAPPNSEDEIEEGEAGAGQSPPWGEY